MAFRSWARAWSASALATRSSDSAMSTSVARTSETLLRCCSACCSFCSLVSTARRRASSSAVETSVRSWRTSKRWYSARALSSDGSRSLLELFERQYRIRGPRFSLAPGGPAPVGLLLRQGAGLSPVDLCHPARRAIARRAPVPFLYLQFADALGPALEIASRNLQHAI